MAAMWTFMVYMAGNNSLSGAAATDLEELRKVGSSDAVKVLAFVKQRSGGARRLQVEKDGRQEAVESLGEIDSGDPQTVVDFFRWGVTKAPAERYALVLWNHGGGWSPLDLEQLYGTVRGDGGLDRRELNLRSTQQGVARSLFTSTVQQILSQPTAEERAVCSDDGTGHSLDTIEVGRVLKKAAEVAGHPLDLLGMDACLMSTLEVAYECLSDAAVVVGSEEPEPGAGWCYAEILADLNAHPEMDGRRLGTVVTNRYIESYREQPQEWPVTQCAVDTSRIALLAKPLDALERALRPHLAADWWKIQQAQMRSARFDFQMVDLRTFCRGLVASRFDADVKAAAGKVVGALAPGGPVVAEGHLGPAVEDCGGISVYLPSPTDAVSKYYKDLRFAKEHRWDEFLRGYHRTARGG